MSLIEVVLAFTVSFIAALGLQLSFSQLMQLEQQLNHARLAREQALFLLAEGQQNPQAQQLKEASLSFQRQPFIGGSFSWQLEFEGVQSVFIWRGVSCN